MVGKARKLALLAWLCAVCIASCHAAAEASEIAAAAGQQSGAHAAAGQQQIAAGSSAAATAPSALAAAAAGADAGAAHGNKVAAAAAQQQQQPYVMQQQQQYAPQYSANAFAQPQQQQQQPRVAQFPLLPQQPQQTAFVQPAQQAAQQVIYSAPLQAVAPQQQPQVAWMPAPQYPPQYPAYPPQYPPGPYGGYGPYGPPPKGYGYGYPEDKKEYGYSHKYDKEYSSEGKDYGSPEPPPPPPPQGVCQSETFGAFYTQPVDIDITSPDDLQGVVSAFIGCKDRTTLGGECSYICYDGEHYERFIGVSTRIVTAPPQDWPTVEPWYHPVYCAWALGGNVTDWKSMPAGSRKKQDGQQGGGADGSQPGAAQVPLFSCDFTIRAECCNDIVPLVPEGPEVDLGEDGASTGSGRSRSSGRGSSGSSGSGSSSSGGSNTVDSAHRIRRRLTRGGQPLASIASVRASSGFTPFKSDKVSGGFTQDLRRKGSSSTAQPAAVPAAAEAEASVKQQKPAVAVAMPRVKAPARRPDTQQ